VRGVIAEGQLVLVQLAEQRMIVDRHGRRKKQRTPRFAGCQQARDARIMRTGSDKAGRAESRVMSAVGCRQNQSMPESKGRSAQQTTAKTHAKRMLCEIAEYPRRRGKKKQKCRNCAPGVKRKEKKKRDAEVLVESFFFGEADGMEKTKTGKARAPWENLPWKWGRPSPKRPQRRAGRRKAQ